MNAFRKWLYKPKKTDKSLLAQFFFADEELNTVAAELDSFDSRKDPERCQALVAQLRACQDRVLTIVQRMMVEAIPYSRTSRDFRVKFPDDVVQENLAGQLWFGAECLAAGSSIMNREAESASMRPLARALTKNLDSLRHILRDQCIVSITEYTERIKEALVIFDKLFAEFELSYVSAMVPVKTVKEYETIQEITVLFSETAVRAKSLGYITTDMIDEYDPALMFTIPRLAIVCGLLIYPDGPLNPDSPSWNMSDMFRPFQTLLYKIRELLFTLSDAELLTLERALCSQQEPDYLDTAASTVTTTASSAPSSRSPTGTITSNITGATKTSTPNPANSTTTTTTNLATTLTPASTTTAAVQTESCLISKTDAEDSVSCSSECSEDSLSAEEQQVHRTRGSSVGEIVCQTGGHHTGSVTDAVSSRVDMCDSGDAKMCEESDNEENEPVNAMTSSSSGSANPPLKNLNKSDSNDSGLHSDVVSNSDSQFTISSSDSNQLLSQSSPLQSPSVEHVSEFCMNDDDDDEGEIADFVNDQTITEQDSALALISGQTLECEGASAKFGMNIVASVGACQDDSVSAENSVEGSPSGRVERCPRLDRGEEEDEDEEEEGFFTPMTGFSPLHQPHSSNFLRAEDSSESLHIFSEAENDSPTSIANDVSVQSHAVSIDAGASQTYMGGNLSSNAGAEARTFSRQFSGVLQKVQAMFTSSPSVSVEADVSWDSEMSDSPMTDTTLTDITPMDSSVTDSNPPLCDNTMTNSCDREMESESDSVQQGSIGSATDSSPDANSCDAKSLPNAAAGIAKSPSQCDRCTQTPHSAINNDQSSKIHHHRKHSSFTSNNSSGSSGSVQGIPVSSGTQTQEGDSKNGVEVMEDSSESTPAQPTTANVVVATSSPQSRTEKKRAEKRCHRSTPNASTTRRCASIKPHKSSRQNSSRRTQTDTLKSQTREARLKQYGKNWSKGERANKSGGQTKENSSGSSGCEGSSSTSDCESDQDSCGSSETSSYNSESHDDEEIALAVQAAELANRNQARARFRSSSDMIHRLFVCISGVADQLQTNFAGDLRNILRVVFNLHCSEPVVIEEEKALRRRRRNRFFNQLGGNTSQNRGTRDPPAWIPDDQSTMCMSCKTPFTFVRRRHHCRNCGKIFCGRCSSNAVSLPHFGHSKPVRVCNHCFVFQVNPFAV